MQPEKLQYYIWQGIRKVVYKDKIELYIPFFFGNSDDTPVCLSWDKDGILSDGGRTFAELKNRVRDITPYANKIQNILNSHRMVELVSGHILTVSNYFTVISGDETYKDYRTGVSKLIEVMSLINIVDQIQLEDDGEVSV